MNTLINVMNWLVIVISMAAVSLYLGQEKSVDQTQRNEKEKDFTNLVTMGTLFFMASAALRISTPQNYHDLSFILLCIVMATIFGMIFVANFFPKLWISLRLHWEMVIAALMLISTISGIAVTSNVKTIFIVISIVDFAWVLCSIMFWMTAFPRDKSYKDGAFNLAFWIGIITFLLSNCLIIFTKETFAGKGLSIGLGITTLVLVIVFFVVVFCFPQKAKDGKNLEWIGDVLLIAPFLPFLVGTILRFLNF